VETGRRHIAFKRLLDDSDSAKCQLTDIVRVTNSTYNYIVLVSFKRLSN